MIICDCHIHSFAKGVERAGGTYVPPEKDIGDFIAEEAQTNGIGRAVIIQASVDGTDNTALARMVASPPEAIVLRGVAMISTASTDLEALAASGIRAARLQDRGRVGINQLDLLPQVAALAAEVDWHVELNTEPERFDRVAAALEAMPAGQPLVLDHFSHVDPTSEAQVTSLCRLLDSGRIWVKLSPTRVSTRPDNHDDLAALVARLVQGWPERCLWGSDWPHVMTPPPVPRLAPMLDLLRHLLPESRLRAVLQDNPAALYRF